MRSCEDLLLLLGVVRYCEVLGGVIVVVKC